MKGGYCWGFLFFNLSCWSQFNLSAVLLSCQNPRDIFVLSIFNHMIDRSDGIKNCSPLDKRVFIKMTSGSTFSKRFAKVLDANLASTFLRDIGRQFFTNVLSFPFFSIQVITACFCEFDSPHGFSVFESIVQTINYQFLKQGPKG